MHDDKSSGTMKTRGNYEKHQGQCAQIDRDMQQIIDECGRYFLKKKNISVGNKATMAQEFTECKRI